MLQLEDAIGQFLLKHPRKKIIIEEKTIFLYYQIGKNMGHLDDFGNFQNKLSKF